jgi:cysteinyl-tRNA synthetase
MSLAYLGDQFEIHTGGIDNVFPHHEDEIAQSEAATGRLPAVHWVHGEHLLMRGRKMAKSAGNFQRVTDLVDDGLDPLALRYLALTSRYRRKLDYSDASLRSAAAGLDSLRSRLRGLGEPPTEGPWAAPAVLEARPAGDRPRGAAEHAAGHGSTAAAPFPLIDRADDIAAPLSNAGRVAHQRFVDAIDDDLDLPGALATVRDALRSELPDEEKRWLALDADLVLGLGLHRAWDAAAGTEPERDALPAEVQQLLDDRSEARAERDWSRADAIRARLNDLGYDVVDGAAGTTTVPRGRVE